MINKLMNIKLIIIGIVLIGMTAFVSCEKEEIANLNAKGQATEKSVLNKEIITLDNIGEGHNYLLAEMEKKPLLRSDNKTFKDVFKDMEHLLTISDKYDFKSNIKPDMRITPEEFMNIFGDIQLNEDFFINFQQRFVTFITNNKYFDPIIANAVINSMNNTSLVDISQLDDKMVGYTSVLVGNNIYNSSQNYWSNYGINFRSTTASDRTVIWVDVGMGICGCACGPIMGMLWGAAASDCYLRCVELSAVN